jgi:hypothetical protein
LRRLEAATTAIQSYLRSFSRRWLTLSRSCVALSSVALSQTGDPTGALSLVVPVGGAGDIRAGTWPDAYYFSTREFAGGSTFVGVERMRLIAPKRWWQSQPAGDFLLAPKPGLRRG